MSKEIGKELRTLFIDIETAPIRGAMWGIWEQNAVWVDEDWFILSVAWKWGDEKKTHCRAISDYKGYKPLSTNDKPLLQDVWNLLNEAHIVVAHNGDEFDIKKLNARFIINGFKPPSPYITVDTKKVAKSVAAFTSNSLANLGEYLGLGAKLETGGHKLWKACIAGIKVAWILMKKYNIQDVILLEKVYYVLRPWAKNHPNMGRHDRPSCTRCSSVNVQSRGTRVMASGLRYSSWACQDCGKWMKSRKLKDNSRTELV